MTEERGLSIYFSASISGGRDDAPRYAALISSLGAFGHVLTEHIGSPGLSDGGEHGPEDHEIYARDMGWLNAADIVVAEVTTPSLGVGYEVARAASLGKTVIALFRPDSGRRLSAMIRGNPVVRVLEYAGDDDPGDVAAKAISLALVERGPEVARRAETGANSETTGEDRGP